MQFLHDHGYTPISLDTWCDAVENGMPLPSKPVIITFDDGWRDQYDYALPILDAFGFKAVFYAYTSVVGNPGTMTWEQLRDLARRGHTIACHSATHSDLVRWFAHEDQAAYERRLQRELGDAKAILEAHVGQSVRHFCYPFGYYNTALVAQVRAAGYVTATTVNPCVNTETTPLYQLGRMIVAPWTTPDELGAFLSSRALPVMALSPRDGAVVATATTTLLVRVPPARTLPLAKVRMKWNWRWADSNYDPVRGIVSLQIPTPLKPSIYTAQVHAWDAASNHYSYAWLFQQGVAAQADDGSPAQRASATAFNDRPPLVLLSYPGR
jgi:peptidoglycan/xylan/chitin deacetylase (PgdA/CDA1 family)